MTCSFEPPRCSIDHWKSQCCDCSWCDHAGTFHAPARCLCHHHQNCISLRSGLHLRARSATVVSDLLPIPHKIVPVICATIIMVLPPAEDIHDCREICIPEMHDCAFCKTGHSFRDRCPHIFKRLSSHANSWRTFVRVANLKIDLS